jgi:hypothetical protein
LNRLPVGFHPKRKRKRGELAEAAWMAKFKRCALFVATVEAGQRKRDVVGLLAFAEAMGVDPREAIKRFLAAKRD